MINQSITINRVMYIHTIYFFYLLYPSNRGRPRLRLPGGCDNDGELSLLSITLLQSRLIFPEKIL